MLPLLLLCLLSVHVTSAKITHIYGAPPRGGFIGGKVNIRSQKASFRSVFPQFEDTVNVASYDPVSHHVLLDVDGPERTLTYGPICKPKSPEPPRYLAKLTSGPLSNSQLGDCLGCKIHGVTMHSSVIYFVISGTWSKDVSFTHLIEIRSFSVCDSCMMRGTDGVMDHDRSTFGVLYNCSTPVADIHRAQFSLMESPDYDLSPMNVLKVINTAGSLSFFLQIKNYTGNEAASTLTLDLYHVTPDSGRVRLLHRESLMDQHRDGMGRAVGSVDYLNQVLCWTAMDRIFCADYVLGAPAFHNLARVLNVADSAIYRVCKGPEPSVLGIVSGIDLVEVTSNSRILVFGCYSGSEYQGVGGIGVISGSLPDWTDREVKPMFQKARFKFGSLFHVDSFAACSFEPVPQMCILRTRNSEPEPSPEDNNSIGGDVPPPAKGESHDPSAAAGNNAYATSPISYFNIFLFICIYSTTT